MKLVAALMMITGAIIGMGAALEFRYFGPGERQFWVGVFTTPAGVLFIVTGMLLWRRARDVKWLVLLAGVVMAVATVAATALDVMGPPATLLAPRRATFGGDAARSNGRRLLCTCGGYVIPTVQGELL